MKATHIIPITFTFLTLMSCGGKNMDGTADYSNNGPHYFNPDYHPHSDTNIVVRPRSYSQTTDMGQNNADTSATENTNPTK
jgi:hypothetical protein